MTINFCGICEERFTVWSDYASHRMNSKCFKKVLPIRTTNRSKAQIVLDTETNGKLKGKIIQ
jgi:hypothetical protein